MPTTYKFRLYLITFILLGGFGVLSWRLYSIQILQKQDYMKAALVRNHKFQSIRVPGIRGEIKDRNGFTLVDSTPNYEMHFDLREILDAYKKSHAEVPQSTYMAYDSDGIERPRPEEDIVAIVEATVFPELQQLGLLADYSSQAMRVHYRSNKGVVPFAYRRDLTFHEFARFAEKNVGIPGVSITRKGRRRYIYDSLACHILGYLNLPDIDKVDEEKKKEYTFYVGDDYGVQGIESTMDQHLQGKAGRVVIEKDEKGKFLGETERTEPQAGSDVHLTIDARLQYAAEQALRHVGRAAAVAVAPDSGEILAIASVPSFNPNRFIPEVSIEDWKHYTEDSTSPLFSRAVNPYAPGSTFKIPVALAGCLSDTWRRSFPCGGGERYGNKFMKCWSSGHGVMDLSEAIKRSCNGFFYRYANACGIEDIEKMTAMLGMGKVTGINITGEKPGTIPGPQFLRQKGLNWSSAQTANTSIGQGYCEATPLQMACVTAWVANGGKVFQPRIIKRIVDRDGRVVEEPAPKIRHDLAREGLTPGQIELVRRGMWRVVNDPGGTAARAQSPLTVISGKTGTAQTGNPREPTNAWFICFAPYEKPEIAVCVFVQNAKSGGGAASPIARNIVEHYMALKNGYSKLQLTRLDEARGNTTFVESVEIDNSELLAAFNESNQTPEPQLAASKKSASVEDEDVLVDADFIPEELRNRGPEKLSLEPFAEPTIREKSDRNVERFNAAASASQWERIVNQPKKAPPPASGRSRTSVWGGSLRGGSPLRR